MESEPGWAAESTNPAACTCVPKVGGLTECQGLSSHSTWKSAWGTRGHESGWDGRPRPCPRIISHQQSMCTDH